MLKSKFSVLGAAIALAIAPSIGSAGVIGFLGNFDVVNDTTQTAHGFEIDLEGVHSSDITDTFGGPGRGFPTGRGFGAGSVERYGSPTITDYTSGSTFGTKVIYQALPTGSGWDYTTPSGTIVTPGDNCWSGGGLGYNASTPCDHFGVGTRVSPTNTTYHWLTDTGYAAVNLPVPAAPAVVGQPVPAPGNPLPPVAMIVQAPPPEIIGEWGDASWVKVYSFENPDPVRLEDLIFGMGPVDQALAEPPEIEWQLLQVDNAHPVGPGNGQLENDNPNPGGDAVVRRYEFYSYAGAYSAEHEALPTFGDSQANSCVYDPANCDPNLPIDVGTFLGAQNAAVNLNGPAAALIPEPETYAMMLAGLGLLGFFARRRKQNVV